MEVLTAFVRERSPLSEDIEAKSLSHTLQTLGGKPKLSTDVQSALTVIGRQPQNQNGYIGYLELSSSNLAGADLSGVNFRGANWWQAMPLI